VNPGFFFFYDRITDKHKCTQKYNQKTQDKGEDGEIKAIKQKIK